MKKIYKTLTQDQKEKGIVFSSTLSKRTTEQPEDMTHEVLVTDFNQSTTINRLLDDKFFNGSHFKYNIIRR